MAEELKSVPACTLNGTSEQYRAVGHMTLQWAFLEAEIDREIVWLCAQTGTPPIKDYPFTVRVGKWLNARQPILRCSPRTDRRRLVRQREGKGDQAQARQTGSLQFGFQWHDDTRSPRTGARNFG